MGEEEQMNQTPNAQLPTPNAERSEHSTLGVERSALDVGRFLWRILDFVVAGIFIFAGITKILDLDHLMLTFSICALPTLSPIFATVARKSR